MLTLLTLLAASALAAPLPSPEELHRLVDRANKALRGDSSHGRLAMTIQTPEWTRTLEIEGWNKDRTLAYIVIHAPPKDRGNTTLRRRSEMWVWLPKVERVIKIPPTMMHSAWMGSDFTYEDIVKSDSLAKDYSYKVVGARREGSGEDARTVYTVECTPKPDAPVVWGKVLTDVAVYDDGQSVLGENERDYSERGELIRTITLSDVRPMAGQKRLPTRLECRPERKPGQKTVLNYRFLEFGLPLTDDFFSYQRLQREAR